MPEPEIVTPQGKPTSDIVFLAGEETLTHHMEAKSKEVVEKGAEVYAKA